MESSTLISLSPLDSSEEEDICNICLSVVEDKFSTTCDHSFCRLCFKKWAKTQFDSILPVTCPTCRNGIGFGISIKECNNMNNIQEFNEESTFIDYIQQQVYLIWEIKKNKDLRSDWKRVALTYHVSYFKFDKNKVYFTNRLTSTNANNYKIYLQKNSHLEELLKHKACKE